MLLRRLGLRGFRCYADIPTVPFHRLTVFVGENDSGKTGVLDALELLLTAKAPGPLDYHRAAAEAVEAIEITGDFELEEHDTVPGDLRTNDGRDLRLTKRFTSARTDVVVQGRRYADERWLTYGRQTAVVQRELLQSLGMPPGANAEARAEQFRQVSKGGLIPRIPGEVPVAFNEFLQHLPHFEKIASAEYRNPDQMVQRTLRAVVDGVLQPEDPETGERRLIGEVVDLQAKVKTALTAKVEQMRATLRSHNPDIVSASVEPSFDFARGVTATNLTIDTGGGPRLMASFGEGMKKKLWMALLDWEESTRAAMPAAPAFRVYDEPDVNLDYAAERRLFGSILTMTRAPARTQAVVCTHSLTLVDRAPAGSINLIEVARDGKRTVSYLTGTPDEVGEFLGDVGRTVGLSNSALFYERAFLLVEGESEENALPILYRNLHGRSLLEDGIVLVNLGSCGGAITRSCGSMPS